MTFKKDYINYLLYSVVSLNDSEFKDNYRLRKLVDSIISMDNVMKITYLIGKTAGLEILFKYLLYISDKIDKSQITIFNLKDNFDYDVMNLTKICAKISQYKSENVQEAIKNITEEAVQEELKEELQEELKETGEENTEAKDPITIESDENAGNLMKVDESELVESAEEESEEESEEDSGDSKLTLIENVESYTGEAEVFELESISESVENSNAEEKQEITQEGTNEKESITAEDSDEEAAETTDEIAEGKPEASGEVFELESLDDDLRDEKEAAAIETKETVPEIEIEVHKPGGSGSEEEHVKEEPITNEAYYKFESKFFEEVKILEKLFASVDKDCKTDSSGKLSEKCLQCLTEIIEITSELSNLSRQLSFDLIADIFFTVNIYFTKAISQQEILTSERIKLLDSSLALVNSLIKGEDYLNYDTIVDKIEKLKTDISGVHEAEHPEEKSGIETKEFETSGVLEKTGEEIHNEPEPVEEAQIIRERPAVKQSQMDSAVFKLKYLIKEFEKSFMSINSLRGEYSKFDALEKIGELNNALRLIAKISSAVKLYDVLKLAEVTYVFLKYVKDYRMDLLEPEIQQIVKYIIFTFKMLLTSRKPEDFNVLVQHLNNPVKIFTDS